MAARLDQEETLRKAAWPPILLPSGRVDIPAARHGFSIWSHPSYTLLISALPWPAAALLVGALSVNHRVRGSIPGQGTCRGCRFSPW